MSAPFGSPDVPLFSFPTVHRKKVVAAFDGGRITSDGDVMLLGAVERQLGIADTLARLISDPRNPALVTHGVDDIDIFELVPPEATLDPERELTVLHPACEAARQDPARSSAACAGRGSGTRAALWGP